MHNPAIWQLLCTSRTAEGTETLDSSSFFTYFWPFQKRAFHQALDGDSVSWFRGETSEKLGVLHLGAGSYINLCFEFSYCCDYEKQNLKVSDANGRVAQRESWVHRQEARAVVPWSITPAALCKAARMRTEVCSRKRYRQNLRKGIGVERVLRQGFQVLVYIYPRNFLGESAPFQSNSKHPGLAVL